MKQLTAIPVRTGVIFLLLIVAFAPRPQAQPTQPEALIQFTLPPNSTTETSIENGAALHSAMGCVTCHSTSQSREGKVGPALRGIVGATRSFIDGSKAVVTEDYLRESITSPAKRVLKGYVLEEGSMPAYGEVLTEPQIDSLVLFIQSLKPEPRETSAKSHGVRPTFDPPDQLFRRAPMPWSSRSIAMPLTPNLHVAFDSKLMRTHTAWTGKGLALFGPNYSGTKTPFICQIEGNVLWHNPPFFPWSIGAIPQKDQTHPTKGSDFKAVSTKDGRTTLIYEIGLPRGDSVRIAEGHVVRSIGDSEAVVRRLEIGPCDQDLWWLAHAEMGTTTDLPVSAKATLIQRTQTNPSDYLLVAARGFEPLHWRSIEANVAYQEQIITDKSTDIGKQFQDVSGHETRAFLKIPARDSNITVDILSVVYPDKSKALEGLEEIATPTGSTSRILAHGGTSHSRRPVPYQVRGEVTQSVDSLSGDDHYQIEPFPLPAEVDLLVGGMDWLPNGDLAVCTWAKGEVWIVRDATGPAHEVTYQRFARGLMEPLGLKVVGDAIYVVQKGELTRLVDTDRDGVADLQECINDDWGFSGNYHSYAFGPVVDREGFFHVFICGRRGRWDLPYAGWDARIDSKTGEISGFASGLRAPNGSGIYGPDRDIFVADNQGDWIGVCKINHVKRGASYGYPAGYPAAKERYDNPEAPQPPAVWIPYDLSQSASGFTTIDTDRFGPFKGQMLVGDFQFGTVLRGYMEKVNGDWQGVIWPFASGFNGALNRVLMGPDDRLYAGGCRRTWPAAKPQEFSLDRVTFTGQIPFEIKEVHARPRGFELLFTKPIDPQTGSDSPSYTISQFRYAHHATYGSPIFNHEDELGEATEISISSVRISNDRLRVELDLENLRPGFVTMIQADGIRTTDGMALRHDKCYYTLNRIP